MYPQDLIPARIDHFDGNAAVFARRKGQGLRAGKFRKSVLVQRPAQGLAQFLPSVTVQDKCLADADAATFSAPDEWTAFITGSSTSTPSMRTMYCPSAWRSRRMRREPVKISKKVSLIFYGCHSRLVFRQPFESEKPLCG